MADRKITIEHNGVDYSGHIATIEATHLGWEDHGILTAGLTLAWDGSGVVFGGYCLDTPEDEGTFTRTGTAYGLDYLMQVMQTVGVDGWEKLRGAKVIALFAGNGGWGSQVKGLAGLDNDKVFIAQEHADSWREEVPSNG